jgi:hypothetical protein
MNLTIKIHKYRKVKVRLDWLIQRKYGFGYPHGIPAHFDSHKEEWSLVIVAEQIPDNNSRNQGLAWLLAEGAPHDWLSMGERFSVIEGTHVMAKGTVEEILTEEKFHKLLKSIRDE